MKSVTETIQDLVREIDEYRGLFDNKIGFCRRDPQDFSKLVPKQGRAIMLSDPFRRVTPIHVLWTYPFPCPIGFVWSPDPIHFK